MSDSYDSNRPAFESSPYSGNSNSEPKLKATITFEGSAFEVKTAIYEQAQETGRLNEVISTLNQRNTELNNRILDLESGVRRERRNADRADDELREARRNHQVVLGREQVLNDRIYNVSDERNKLQRENERLKAAILFLAGGEEAAKKMMENFDPAPQTASSETEVVRRYESPGLDRWAREAFDNMTPSQFSSLMREFAAECDREGNPGKIRVIKMVRTHLNAGLKAAKDLVEYGEIR